MNLKLAGESTVAGQESVTRSASTKRMFQGMSFEQAEENFKLIQVNETLKKKLLL